MSSCGDIFLLQYKIKFKYNNIYNYYSRNEY